MTFEFRNRTRMAALYEMCQTRKFFFPQFRLRKSFMRDSYYICFDKFRNRTETGKTAVY